MSRKKPHVIKRANPNLRTLGRRLRELRGIDLTQGELANELGISQSQLSKYERGVAAPPADILFFIKQRFQVSVDWLLTGEGPKESNAVRS
jgi:transcriptional regulator with XRE-family HTH domain